MNYTRDKELRIAHNNQQIIVLKDLINKMELSKETILKFDNKQLNIKLHKSLNELKTNSSGINGNNNEYYSGIHCNTKDRIINYRTRENRYYKFKKEQSVRYVDIDCITIRVDVLDNKKINAKSTIGKIETKIIELQNIIQEMEQEQYLIDEMIKDFEEVQKQIDVFTNKYSRNLRTMIDFITY